MGTFIRTKLFTWEAKHLNWFLWGDIFYVLSSIMFTLQPIFQMYANPDIYTYERDCNYYFVTNIIMLIDASCYSIGYHYYMVKLRESLVNGIIQAAHNELE